MKRRTMTLLLALCLIFTLLPFAASAEDSTAYVETEHFKVEFVFGNEPQSADEEGNITYKLTAEITGKAATEGDVWLCVKCGENSRSINCRVTENLQIVVNGQGHDTYTAELSYIKSNNEAKNYDIGVFELNDEPTGSPSFDELKVMASSYDTTTALFPIITGAATDDVLMEFELDEDSYEIVSLGYPNVEVDITVRMSAFPGFQPSGKYYGLFVFKEDDNESIYYSIYIQFNVDDWSESGEAIKSDKLGFNLTEPTNLIFLLVEYEDEADSLNYYMNPPSCPDDLNPSDVFTLTVSYYCVQYDDGADDNSVAGMPDTKVVAGGGSVAQEAPERENYVFMGWDSDNDGEADCAPGAAITNINSDLSLKAVWGHNVTLVYGNGDIETVPVKDGATYALPAASRPGYIFLGWKYGDKTCSAGDEFTVSGDMTFTAVWANMPDITPGAPDEPDEGLPFKDVREGQWFYEAVEYVYGAGIMDGTGSGIFAPNGTLTRAMAWTILARLDGVDTDGGATWYSIAQEWAIAKGISDGTEPMADITREQLVTMLYRFAEMNGADVTQGGMGIKEYEDYAEISDWALTAMVWAANNGVIEGDAGLLRPTAACTRAEAAAILMRSCDNIL